MSAFVIVEIEIHNPELYTSYTALTPETIENHQGKFIVRGGETKVLEGDHSPQRTVILEFPSMEAADSWWHSEAYTKARKIRQQAATTKMTIVQGV
ncbi:DUF1330 domain-containing protein [Lutimonas sp.]|uniref:DUF1330 domain-containing protein n=1 Tax=Lutimonas sp. TaxID=1872403 RepID=UPI003D9B933C